MSRNSIRSGNDRLKYGICLNDECSMCKNKEVQAVPMRKDLVCSECGKELRECAPPKKKRESIGVIITVVAVAAVVAGLFFVLGGREEQAADSTIESAVEELPSVQEPVIAEPVSDTLQNENVDSIVAVALEEEVDVAQEPVTKNEEIVLDVPKVSGAGELSLSYGKYSGAIKNGYPHGQGRLTYTKARVINRHDMKAREAKPGNYIIGEFHNGFVVYGKLYDANGNLLSSLNFGVSNEDSYDSQ